MDKRKLSAVAHEGMAVWNPLGNAAVEKIVQFAGSLDEARILDIGCGRADVLLRAAEKCDGQGVGIDPWPHAIELARRTAARKPTVKSRFMEAPFDVSLFEPASFDVVMCVGATHACGGFAGTLDAMSKLLRPGGRAAIGEGYWLQPPSPEYLAVLRTTADELGELDALAALAEAGGFRMKGSFEASRSERDAYENAYRANVERWVQSHPASPDAPEMLDHVRAWHQGYLDHGRATLGFAVLFLVKD